MRPAMPADEPLIHRHRPVGGSAGRPRPNSARLRLHDDDPHRPRFDQPRSISAPPSAGSQAIDACSAIRGTHATLRNSGRSPATVPSRSPSASLVRSTTEDKRAQLARVLSYQPEKDTALRLFECVSAVRRCRGSLSRHPAARYRAASTADAAAREATRWLRASGRSAA
jgi:hypothetical protein